MSAILYPVAPNAESALAQPLGRAAREKEAGLLAQGPVSFVTEPAGPAYPTYAAAMEAFGGRIDDPEHGRSVQPEDRYCSLRELVAPMHGHRPKTRRAKPVFKDGKRWSAPITPPTVVWRLSVSYWRVADAQERAEIAQALVEQARRARRQAVSEELDPASLRAMALQPMRAFRPQQPLDIGLFEFRPPDAPHLLMPDE